MIGRRDFIAGLGSVIAWPFGARAQQADRMRRIGVLMWLDENEPGAKSDFFAFTQALADLGWTDGRNVRMDVRWYGDDINRIRALVQELVGLQPDVILASGAAIAALQRETRTIPIVFAGVNDAVANGIVTQLARPSGNTTGFAILKASLGGKWLQLLSEIAPGLRRAEIMFNPDNPDFTPRRSIFMPSLETAARSLKVVPIPAPIETAIMALGREPGGGLVVMPGLFMYVHRAPIILAAARNNVPAVYSLSDFARDGGLLSYGNDLTDTLSSCRHLCRSHSAWREAGGATRSAADQVRDGRQPQDRQGARPCGTPIDSGGRRRGDRIGRDFPSGSKRRIDNTAHSSGRPKSCDPEACNSAHERIAGLGHKRTCMEPGSMSC
jgi:putative tryptophan/tyrosine transport system substrate-binding protein